MNPQRANVYILGDNEYVLINRKMYRLEELDYDGIAEVFNGGDALPIMQNPV